MKQFTNKKGKEFFLIEVPERTIDFHIPFYKKEPMLSYRHLGALKHSDKELPSGNYQIIGLAKDVSEEVSSTIIDGIKAASWGTWYVDYSAKYDKFSFEHATESLSSLIQSLGLNKNVLILEKVR